MRKALPFVLVSIFGLLLAFLLFGPEAPAEPDTPEPAEARPTPRPVSAGADEPEDEEEEPAPPVPGQAPPEGTLRPMNKAEIENRARLDRTYNKHYARVAAYWTRAGQLLVPMHPELAGECGRMERYLRDQSNSNELDVEATIANELALVAKIREVEGSKELGWVLDYIRDSAQVTLDGGDVTTVLKPSERKAAEEGAGSP